MRPTLIKAGLFHHRDILGYLCDTSMILVTMGNKQHGKKTPITPIKTAVEIPTAISGDSSSTDRRTFSREASKTRTNTPAATVGGGGEGRSMFFELTRRMNRRYAWTDYASDGCTEDIIFIRSVCQMGMKEKIALKLLSLGVVELCQQIWRQHFDDENLFEEDSFARTNLLLFMWATSNLTDNLTDNVGVPSRYRDRSLRGSFPLSRLSETKFGIVERQRRQPNDRP